MTTVEIEEVTFDLEQFATQLKVFNRHMRANTLMIPTPESMEVFIERMIEESQNVES